MGIVDQWASEDDVGRFLIQESLEEIAGQASNDGEGENWMSMDF